MLVIIKIMIKKNDITKSHSTNITKIHSYYTQKKTYTIIEQLCSSSVTKVVIIFNTRGVSDKRSRI